MPNDERYDGVVLLIEYHDQVRRRLAEIRTIEADLEVGGADFWEEARTLAGDVLDFMDTYGPLHEQDETNSLLPRLINALRRAGDDQSASLQLVAEMDEEHVHFREVWAPLAHDLALIATPDAVLSRRHFRDSIAAIEAHYLPHFEREEASVFPLAHQWLSANERHEIALEILGRRGRRHGATADPDTPG